VTEVVRWLHDEGGLHVERRRGTEQRERERERERENDAKRDHVGVRDTLE
jgi:hypothetical protein